MGELQTLSQAIELAKGKGFTATFKAEEDGLHALESDAVFRPNDVTIVDHQRFEGQSSEDDASVLYLIECNDGTKGTIVDAYGTYADPNLATFIRGVTVDEDR